MARKDQAANDLPALSVRRPYLAAVANLLIVIAGISAIFGVEVRELPDVDRPIVTVRANYPGASPETIDAEVTSRVEAAVARVNGVKAVRSSSEEDNFRIRVEFNPSANLVDAANEVREAVSRVERELPEGVEDIFIIKADADAQSIVRLSAYSDHLTIEELTRRVRDEIVPDIMSVDGVADVNLFGTRQRVLRVVVDPMKLAGYQLSIADVVEVLRNARYDVPAGSFSSDRQEVLVRANASVDEPSEIEKLIVRDPVRVGDVASASFGPEDAESLVRLNGRTVINLGVIRQAKSNTVEISRGVSRVVEKVNTRQKDVRVEITSDDATFIKGAIKEVLTSLALAIVIVVSVVALFARQIRAAFIPTATIPVALIGTIAAIWLLGFSINLISLLALVLAAGLVVDDSIVVLENIQRYRARGLASRAASVIAARQVFFAVIATTVTLVSVFLPISFLPSTAGRLFVEFGVVLSIAVIISSFVALTLCPMLAARLPDKATVDSGETSEELGPLRSVFRMVIDRVIGAPLVALGVCSLVIVGAAITHQKLGEELVPKEDRGLLSVLLTGPDGTGLDYTDRQVEQVEEIFRPYVEKGTVSNLLTITGRWDLNRGWIDAPLKDWSEREESVGEIYKKLNPQVRALTGAQARIIRRNSLRLRGSGAGIRFALTGSNYQRLLETSEAFVIEMERNIPQLSNMRVEFRATQPQVSINIDRRRASDLDVPIENLAATIQVLVDNDEIGELTVDDQTVPIIVEATQGAIRHPSDLRRLYVSARDGSLVPLSQLVTFEEDAVAAELDRHGQSRAIEIDADISDDFSMREAVDAIRALAFEKLPSDTGVLFLREAGELDETSKGVQITFAIALLVVFLVLVAQFESITSALIVLLTVPFGICAAVFALALTGTTINIYSQIGVLMLIGIMAKNAILMVEFADQLRDEGRSVLEAAREASLVRVRPIVMTMVSTILAGLPLILGSGPGSEARSAIGWVVFGGLGMAAVFTLFLTPALYVLIANWSKPRGSETARLDDEMAQAEKLTRAPRRRRRVSTAH